MTIENLQPEKVFMFFRQICAIPHPSYQLEAIGEYLVNFAASRGLKHWMDTDGNVVMMKPATPGYERKPSVILQGHMDMVAVSTSDSEIDPEWQGLKLLAEDGYLYAEGTSLGGDDGIAIAYILAILDSDDIEHPGIEAVFTANEEVGMEGALGIDLSSLNGKSLLNIDSEEEGILLTGCAGGICLDARIPVKRDFYEGKKLQIHVDGLIGGHSGIDIHKERGNSNCLMGRVLSAISSESLLVDLQGGLKDNAIPRVTSAILIVREESAEERIESILRKLRIEFLKELWGRDDGINITWAWTMCNGMNALTPESTKSVANFLVAAPNGVVKMSDDIEGVVETSLNMGIVRMEQEELQVGFSLRSLVTGERTKLQQKVQHLVAFFGGNCVESGEYPAWTPRKDSALKEQMIRVYKECYGESPEVTVVHAGLECGILATKIADLDCISFGPNVLNIHTTEEKLEIESVRRVWEFLLCVLADKEETDESLIYPIEPEDTEEPVTEEEEPVTEEEEPVTEEEEPIAEEEEPIAEEEPMKEEEEPVVEEEEPKSADTGFSVEQAVHRMDSWY